MRIQLAKKTRQLPVGKKVQWPGVLVVGNFPEGIMISEKCSDSNSDITSALEIANSGANLVSDRKVDFSRNLECALADFYGHYSSQDLHMHTWALHSTPMLHMPPSHPSIYAYR